MMTTNPPKRRNDVSRPDKPTQLTTQPSNNNYTITRTQVGIASFRPGAKDKGQRQLKPEEAELEEFLFENQIDFVSDQASYLYLD